MTLPSVPQSFCATPHTFRKTTTQVRSCCKGAIISAITGIKFKHITTEEEKKGWIRLQNVNFGKLYTSAHIIKAMKQENTGCENHEANMSWVCNRNSYTVLVEKLSGKILLWETNGPKEINTKTYLRHKDTVC
jgi:O6-methylguanine-DNA--protein-cysteine methyltransferase